MNTKAQIIAAIDAHIQSIAGYTNADWYVGIASDIEQRLFGDHAVDRKLDSWIYRKAISDAVARDTEAAYHAAGCDGGPGGGDRTTVFVYAYAKSSRTDP